ncbi:hypothetical protein GCM10027291_06200 [Telluribacter humicola]
MHQAAEVKDTNVLNKVHGIGMIGTVRSNGHGIMIDAGHYPGAVSTVNSGRGTASSTKKIYVGKLNPRVI